MFMDNNIVNISTYNVIVIKGFLEAAVKQTTKSHLPLTIILLTSMLNNIIVTTEFLEVAVKQPVGSQWPFAKNCEEINGYL